MYWFTSVPFIYEDENGQLAGIEHDLLVAFQDFVQKRYGVTLRLNWIKAPSFYSILEAIRTTSDSDDLGVSAFSITEDRKEYLRFTDSYLPDITVLVSSQGTPIVHTFEEIHQLMEGMEAITIKGTNYENLLRNLKEQLDLDFEIRYIGSDENVLDKVAMAPNRFGFIDLPIYLMLMKKGGDLTRQNLFTVRGTGYGMILSKTSDWHVPFNEFLDDTVYHHKVAHIIAHYLGTELYEFIDNLYSGEELGTSILTKEKELQLALIKNANLKLEEDRTFQMVLMVGIGVTSFLLVLIGILFYNNQKNTRLLMMQKGQIEAQQEDIRLKNEQLLNRNVQLIGLNEEKNHLMKIFAHDLRSPLSQIIGLSGFLNSHLQGISAEDRELLEQIGQSAVHINSMISKILDVDAIEGNKRLVLREQVNVRQITRDIANRYRPVAAQKEIRFELRQPEANCLIETDHLLLFLVLENLVSNAVKFSSPHTSVSLVVEPREHEVWFRVSDEGPGFTETDKLLLFNRFQKLSARPTAGETSIGLGLSIVKKYVTDLGGKVWLDSSRLVGSTFIVSLPI